VSQVIVNLISNSVKFTQGGEIKIVVQWKPTIRPHDSSISLNLWFSTESIKESTELSKVETSGIEVSLDVLEENGSLSSEMEFSVEVQTPENEVDTSPKFKEIKVPSPNHQLQIKS
jgi:hypothetical protein